MLGSRLREAPQAWSHTAREVVGQLLARRPGDHVVTDHRSG